MKLSLLLFSLFVSSLLFSQKEIDPDKNIQTNDLGNVRLTNKKGEGITPFVFIRLEYVGKNRYVFTADSKFRGNLAKMISSNIDDSTNRVFNEDQFEEQMDMESYLVYNIFKGIISAKGEILGGEDFRMVDFIRGTEKNPMFEAQSQTEFEKNEDGKLALIDKDGQALSGFVCEFIAYENKRIIAMKVDEQNKSTFMEFNMKGKLKKEDVISAHSPEH